MMIPLRIAEKCTSPSQSYKINPHLHTSPSYHEVAVELNFVYLGYPTKEDSYLH